MNPGRRRVRNGNRRRRRFRLGLPFRASPAPGLPASLSAPHWLAHTETVAGTGFWSILARLPSLARQAVHLAWEVSPAGTLTVLALEICSGALISFGLFATADVLGALISAGPTPDRVRAALPSLLLVGGAAALRALLQAGIDALHAQLSPRVEQLAEERLLELTTRVGLRAFDEPSFYDAMQRARDRGVASARVVVDDSMQVLAAVIGLLAAGGTLAVLHPVLLPLLVLSSAARGWAAVRTARQGYLSWHRWVAVRRRKVILSELLANRDDAPEVRAFTARPFLLGEHRTLAAAATAESIRLSRVQTATELLGNALAGVSTAVVYLTLGLLLSAGAMPLSVAGTAVFAIRIAQNALDKLVEATNSIYENGLYFGDYTKFMAVASGFVQAPRPALASLALREIRVEQVTFTYPAGVAPALDGVSLTIRRGEVIALVGENGSGKTTLAKILAGLYEPQGGCVHWNGVPLTEIDPESVRRQVAVVMQGATRWPMTARTNIRLGRYERDDGDEPLRQAAAHAGADVVVAALPHGYDTLLAPAFQGGTELSGGQWQRLAIARAFYRDADLLIFDEPTSHLDPRSEHAVYQRVQALAKGRSVVLITHRLASAHAADHIYVLDHGRISEHGTHADLLARGGSYAEMFTLQAAAHGDGVGGHAVSPGSRG